MSVIAECLSEVRLGAPRTHLNLTLYPLLAEGPAEPGYLLLDAALDSGCAHVTEVSESGSVPELKFVNDCGKPVLLLDGEELIGAKQNRILNLTVLAPAQATIVIPVSCVEAGRWNRRSEEFTSAKRAHYAAGRARKAAQVSASMRSSGSRRSDQGEVWSDIAEKSARMEAHSDTGAAEALYERHRESLEAFKSAFVPFEGQVGALFAIDGHVVGLDLFDSPATLAAVQPKLVESYALDALDSHKREAGASDPQSFLESATRARVETFPALGEGEDLRVRADGLAGGALVKDARVVHLCLFRVAADENQRAQRTSRLARSYQRRHGYTGERS
ncbi:MAG: DUF6569 family protein [Gammaproteobacteria bacterium]|nr:DUF6569 family protein [Gammaproteobacteria bacterium]